jgi:hypothetical protein
MPKNGVILLKDKVLFNQLMDHNWDQLLGLETNRLLNIQSNGIQVTEDTSKFQKTQKSGVILWKDKVLFNHLKDHNWDQLLELEI